MLETILLPGAVFTPMAGALITYLIGRRSKTIRNITALAVTVAESALLLGIILRVCEGENPACELPAILGGLRFTADGFRSTYTAVAGLMWMMTTLFSAEYLHHYRILFYLSH